MSHPRAARVEAVLASAIAQALRDSGRVAIMVMEPSSFEGAWLLDLCERKGVAARPAPEPSAALLEVIGGDEEAARLALGEAEARREGLLASHPANRTALLLSAAPRAPLLPLGDVPASVVDRHRGGWTAPDAVRDLADAAGGIHALDACLHRWLDRREAFDIATERLPDAVARDLRCGIRRARFFRLRAGLVPKLGYRTMGHDLQF